MRRSFPVLAPVIAALLAPGSACKPDLGDRASLVDRPMVIAVLADPPETKAGEQATYRVVVVGPDGTAATPSPSWSFCATPKLLTENGSVSALCADGTGVRGIGVGAPDGSVSAPTPADACAIFGPEVTSADLRPRDPDVTGGFYQPVRVEIGDPHLVAFGFERLGCNLAGAPADVVRDFAARYTPNKNPTLAPLEARVGDAPVAFDAIARGSRVVFRASWPPESAEAYVAFDPTTRLLVNHRESLRVSWFATSGAFDHDRTGRDEDDPDTFTDDAWTAPDAPSVAHVWVVLRDARGGATFAEAALTIR